MISSADDAFSSNSPFSSESPPPHAPQSRSSPRLVTINGIDEMEKWSSSAVLLFIQAKILNDLLVLKLRCVPPQAKAISVAEAVHWKRTINLKVLNELKLSGVHHPPPFVPVVAPPSEMKFELPDYSSATGTAKEKATLLKEAKALHDQARVDHAAEVKANAVRLDAFNANALKEHQGLMIKFDSERESMYHILHAQCISDARLSVWLQLLPSLGDSFYRINETVDFAMPAELVKALESAVFRNEEGEGEQLQLQLWNATLAVEGRGDPYQFHRFILLAGRKLALLRNEPIRESEMRSVLIKGLPDEIFLNFKTGLHNHPSGSKTFEEVFSVLKIFSSSSSAKPMIDDLIRRCERQYSKPTPAGVFMARTSTRPLPATPTQQPCFDFSKGKCVRGKDCKFAHVPGSAASSSKTSIPCSHCSKTGHSSENCFTKFPEKRRARNNNAAAPKMQQPASRATSFLLDMRRNVEELLLENSDKHEAQADCFMFTTVPSALPPTSTVDSAAIIITTISALPTITAVDDETSVVTSSLFTSKSVIQNSQVTHCVNHSGESLNRGSLSSTPQLPLDVRSSAMLSSEDDVEQLHSLEDDILLPTNDELATYPTSFLQQQQQLQTSTVHARAGFLTLDNGTHIYLPTHTDVSSVSSLQSFVYNARAGSASAINKDRKTKKRAASAGVKKRAPAVSPWSRPLSHAPYHSTICPEDSDDSDEDPPELVSSTDDSSSDDSDYKPKRKP